jgi:transcriptional regulator with XRE-family HTH domain
MIVCSVLGFAGIMPTAYSLAELIRLCRYELALNQRELARTVGASPARISAYESGKRQPTIAATNELLRGLGLQIVLSTEPVDAQLDRQIAEIAAEPLGARLLRITPNVRAAVSFLEDAAPVVDGAAAALLHGAPVAVQFTDLVIAKDQIDTVARQFAWLPPVRWSDSLGRYSTSLPVDPRLVGAMRWRSSWGELRIRFVEELPPTVAVHIPPVWEGSYGCDLRVMTIDRVGVQEPDVARLVDRVIERSRAHSAQATAVALTGS